MYEIRYGRDESVLILRGDHDISNKQHLRNILDRLPALEISVDLRFADFIDSSVLNAVVDCHKRKLANGGKLSVLLAPESKIARIFEITMLHKILNLRFVAADSEDVAMSRSQGALDCPAVQIIFE